MREGDVCVYHDKSIKPLLSIHPPLKACTKKRLFTRCCDDKFEDYLVNSWDIPNSRFFFFFFASSSFPSCFFSRVREGSKRERRWFYFRVCLQRAYFFWGYIRGAPCALMDDASFFSDALCRNPTISVSPPTEG